MANIGKDPHIVLLAAIPGFIDTLSAMMVQL